DLESLIDAQHRSLEVEPGAADRDRADQKYPAKPTPHGRSFCQRPHGCEGPGASLGEAKHEDPPERGGVIAPANLLALGVREGLIGDRHLVDAYSQPGRLGDSSGSMSKRFAANAAAGARTCETPCSRPRCRSG